MLKNMKRLISWVLLSKRNIAISLSSLIAFSAGLGYASYELTKDTVSLDINGRQQVLRTHASTVADILQDYHLKIRSEDHLYPPPDTRIKDHLKIVLDQSRLVNITVGNKEKAVWTTAETVKDLLVNQKIQVNEHDVVKPSLNASIEKNMKISIDKAFPVILNVGGKERHVWSTSTTVADFLEQQKVKVDKLDRIEPSLDTKINKNSIVKVIKVEKVIDVVEEPIDYAVVTKKDGYLAKGKTRVIRSGEKGRMAKHYEVILENGKEVSRKLIATKKVKESVDRVVAVGIKVPQTQVSRGTHPASKEFYVLSTAYTAFCSGCSGHTATGINLRTNPDAKVIAVDPSVIPLGTKVYVEGYGYAIAADTGSDINGFRIDVFFSDKSDAYRWGTRKVKIKILN